MFGVRWRLLLIWVLTTGTPIVGLVLVLTAPRGKTHVVGVSIVVAVVTLLLGGYSTALAAKAIGNPLCSMVEALHRVEEGDLDVTVPIEDAGEIGLVQSGFNAMVGGLRDRERIQDLFGRHVGPAVAGRGDHRRRHPARRGARRRRAVRRHHRLDRADPGDRSGRVRRHAQPVLRRRRRRGRGQRRTVEQVRGRRRAVRVRRAGRAGPTRPPPRCATARAIRDRVAEMGELQIGIGVGGRPGDRRADRRGQPARVHDHRRRGERGRPADRAGQAGGRQHPGQRRDGRGGDAPRSRRTGSPDGSPGCAVARRRRTPTGRRRVGRRRTARRLAGPHG